MLCFESHNSSGTFPGTGTSDQVRAKLLPQIADEYEKEIDGKIFQVLIDQCSEDIQNGLDVESDVLERQLFLVGCQSWQ